MNSNVSDWKQANSSMNIQPDFEEFLRLLETHQVDYMIVGGYAVAFHGYVRFTKDIDIFFASSPPNIERLRHALAEFGFIPQRRFDCQRGPRFVEDGDQGAPRDAQLNWGPRETCSAGCGYNGYVR
jgi:hypothetical protein